MSGESNNPDVQISDLREGFDDTALNDTVRSIENSLNVISDILKDIDARLKVLE